MRAYSENMFQSELAEYYDRMRSFRDYGMEAGFADSVIRRYRPGAEMVLDVCCGTGEHALKMADLGYAVTGVDRSDDMLAVARGKADRDGKEIPFLSADVCDLGFEERFDAAYCLGYTFLYMTTHEKVRQFFGSVYRALAPGGVFILDFINGWSLIGEFTQDKFTYLFGDTTIYQSEKTELDRQNRTKKIAFQYVFDIGDGQTKKINAEENLRIFFDDEVKLLLEASGFTNVASYGDHNLTAHSGDIPNIVLVSGVKDR